MKSLVLLLSAITGCFFSLSGLEMTGKSGYSNGFRYYGRETLDCISGNGVVVLNGTIVKGHVQVNGNLEAKDARIGGLNVNGQASLLQCVVVGETTVDGLLKAANTRFDQIISLASQKTSFDRCILESITMRESQNDPDRQILEFRNRTKVSGPIYFESGKGEIRVLSGSEISVDTVSGAEVI